MDGYKKKFHQKIQNNVETFTKLNPNTPKIILSYKYAILFLTIRSLGLNTKFKAAPKIRSFLTHCLLHVGLSRFIRSLDLPEEPTGSNLKPANPITPVGRRQVFTPETIFGGLSFGFPPLKPKKPEPTERFPDSSQNF